MAFDIPSPEVYYGGPRRAGERPLPWERWTREQLAAYGMRGRRAIAQARAGSVAWLGLPGIVAHAYVTPEGDTRGLALCRYIWRPESAKPGGERCPDCMALVGIEADDPRGRLERATALRNAARVRKSRAFRAE